MKTVPAMRKTIHAIFLLLFNWILAFGGLAQTAEPTTSGSRNSVTLHDEFRILFDIALLPSYCTNTMQKEETTYDRLGGNNDGFAGTWSFVHRNPDSSLVMLDIDGPGVIDRFATSTPTSDTLDFYIDDKAIPALSICYRDLFAGARYPFVSPLCGSAVGGYFCYFPILFQTHCRIVCRGKKLQFHQIGYRLFASGTTVTPFFDRLTKSERNDLSRIADLWQNPQKMVKGKKTIQSWSILPGQTQAIGQWSGGGRINVIELDTAGAKDCRLRIYWDGQVQPAIDCPVSQFFGYALQQPAMQSLLIGTRRDKNYIYFPMPFDHSARVELINTSSSETCKGKATLWYSTQARNPEKEGYFCVQPTNRHLGTNDPYDVLLNIAGKGHYVGTILIGQGDEGVNGTPFWEGDDSTVVDDSILLHGTGTEDYFNGGWYNIKGRWDRPFSLPLSGCLGYSSERSWSGGYRLLISDKIPFKKSIYQGFEHGGTVHGAPAQYSSVVFYYSDSPTGGHPR
jgi:Protein of unknown function (DUF2961)